MGNVNEGQQLSASALKCQYCGAQCRTVLVKILHEEECKAKRARAVVQVARAAQQLEQIRKLEELKRLLAVFHITTEMLAEDDDDDAVVKSKPSKGMRVVRGPSWRWENQDGGEGCLGTIIKVNDGKMCDVLWDKGTVANYRIGQNQNYDLSVLDNAPAGVKHPGIKCDACRTDDIRGTRWMCWECEDYDLCTTCYMADKHILRHKFVRFDSEHSAGCLIPARSNSNEDKIQSKGLFAGATVVRGLNWGWRDQDGGRGGMGRVTKVVGFRDALARDGAQVLWGNGNEHKYMVGCDGEVDLKCISTGNGMKYYGESLLPCGVEEPVTTIRPFRIGQRVKFKRHPLVMKKMMRGHGGWHHHMIALMDKPGTIKGFESNNDVLVKYDREEIGIPISESDCVWKFNPAALMKC